MADESVAFVADVSDWVRQMEGGLEAVFRQSVQDLVDVVQTVGPSVASTRAARKANPGKVGPPAPAGSGGRMPVDLGFLRASARITTDQPAPLAGEAPGTPVVYDPGPLTLAIAGLKLGDVVYFTYTARYARAINYGFKSFPGYHFVELGAQRWPQIVADNAARLEQLVTGGEGA